MYKSIDNKIFFNVKKQIEKEELIVMAKHRLFLLTSLVFLSNTLSSCNAVLPLWDYSNLYEYNQDEHYKIKDGKKVSIEKHIKL